MTILPFNRVNKTHQSSGSEDRPNETFLTMFSASEHLTLGLLMGRLDNDDLRLFKDVQLEANEYCASMNFSFIAQTPPYMHIDKIKTANTHLYKLRRENMPEIVRDNLNDIYEIARDSINMMLGEAPFESHKHEKAQTPHLRLVEI